MGESATIRSSQPLDWLPYHRAIVDHLKEVDRYVWDWFANSVVDPKSAEEVRFDLLKATYRIDRESQTSLYDTAADVARRLGIEARISIYQSQNPMGLNASLAYVPGEIQIVLHGPIAEKLTAVEIEALFGHEMGHYLLRHRSSSEAQIAAEMLHALCNDSSSHPAHFASARLLQLYDEIFCDRASYVVTGDLNAVVSMLVKVHTGVQDVNADSYLRQAEEILPRGPAATKEITHPEAFIRARSVQLWSQNDPRVNDIVCEMIEGKPGLDELDLLAQRRVAIGTRRLVDALLCHQWFQTDLALAHARLYFEDFVPAPNAFRDAELLTFVRTEPDSIRDYWCYVLLDFVSADRELDEAPLAKALELADQLGLKDRISELARHELKLRKSQIEQIDQQREKIIADADRSMSLEI